MVILTVLICCLISGVTVGVYKIYKPKESGVESSVPSLISVNSVENRLLDFV